jgi:hypothetical protein
VILRERDRVRRGKERKEDSNPWFRKSQVLEHSFAVGYEWLNNLKNVIVVSCSI